MGAFSLHTFIITRASESYEDVECAETNFSPIVHQESNAQSVKEPEISHISEDNYVNRDNESCFFRQEMTNKSQSLRNNYTSLHLKHWSVVGKFLVC